MLVIFRKMRNILNFNQLLVVYAALFQSVLEYKNILTPIETIKKLF